MKQCWFPVRWRSSGDLDVEHGCKDFAAKLRLMLRRTGKLWIFGSDNVSVRPERETGWFPASDRKCSAAGNT